MNELLIKLNEKHNLFGTKVFVAFPDKLVQLMIGWLLESEFEWFISRIDTLSKTNKKYEKYKKMIKKTLKDRWITTKNEELLWK